MQHDFILLDRSGSMHTQWAEALSAINGYVAKLAEDKIDTGVTLAAFDKNAGDLDFKVLRDRITPETWRPVTPEDAQPRGLTPLSDATGRIVALANAGNYDKVAIIIMTDGAENASRELTVPQARRLLDDCRKKNWQVLFLGANFDNSVQAESYGATQDCLIQSSTKNMGATMGAMASSRAAYATTGARMKFTDKDKADALKR
jgi:hypothetical protein